MVEFTEEQTRVKEKIDKIFEENNWNPNTIRYISVEYDENMELKAIINFDEEEFILKNIWVREDFRGTGYTQDFLKRVFREYTFMFVWEPNIDFIKAMVKAGLGLHKTIQRMDVWFLIPQMLSDISNGFISRDDYIINKNGHYYVMGTALDNTRYVNPIYKELDDNLTDDELKTISKGTEIILKKSNLIWNRCNASLRTLVQEFSKDWMDSEKIAYQNKMERSRMFMEENLNKTRKEFEKIKDSSKYIDI